MYIYDNLICPIALISIIQIIVEMDSAVQNTSDILNGDIQYERGRPRIELFAEELIFFVGKNELNSEITLCLRLVHIALMFLLFILYSAIFQSMLCIKLYYTITVKMNCQARFSLTNAIKSN